MSKKTYFGHPDSFPLKDFYVHQRLAKGDVPNDDYPYRGNLPGYGAKPDKSSNGKSRGNNPSARSAKSGK